MRKVDTDLVRLAMKVFSSVVFETMRPRRSLIRSSSQVIFLNAFFAIFLKPEELTPSRANFSSISFVSSRTSLDARVKDIR